MGRIGRALVVVGFVSMSTACGGPGTESTWFKYDTTTSTLGDSPTTVPPVPESDIPALVDCPLDRINADTDETFRDVIRCAGDWAAGVPQRFVDQWDENTDNEAEWLLARDNGVWKVVGVCHAYYPLVGGGPCNDPYGDDPVDASLFPPMNVQCALWGGASVGEFTSMTGCPAKF